MSDQIDYGWGYKADLDEIRIHAILDVTRGLSPECVAACVEAVRAQAAYTTLHECELTQHRLLGFCDKAAAVAFDTMDTAVALLPKEGT